MKLLLSLFALFYLIGFNETISQEQPQSHPLHCQILYDEPMLKQFAEALLRDYDEIIGHCNMFFHTYPSPESLRGVLSDVELGVMRLLCNMAPNFRKASLVALTENVDDNYDDCMSRLDDTWRQVSVKLAMSCPVWSTWQLQNSCFNPDREALEKHFASLSKYHNLLIQWLCSVTLTVNYCANVAPCIHQAIMAIDEISEHSKCSLLPGKPTKRTDKPTIATETSTVATTTTTPTLPVTQTEKATTTPTTTTTLPETTKPKGNGIPSCFCHDFSWLNTNCYCCGSSGFGRPQFKEFCNIKSRFTGFPDSAINCLSHCPALCGLSDANVFSCYRWSPL